MTRRLCERTSNHVISFQTWIQKEWGSLVSHVVWNLTLATGRGQRWCSQQVRRQDHRVCVNQRCGKTQAGADCAFCVGRVTLTFECRSWRRKSSQAFKLSMETVAHRELAAELVCLHALTPVQLQALHGMYEWLCRCCRAAHCGGYGCLIC